MLLVAITIAVAVAIGYARGGRLTRIGAVRLDGVWLVAVAALTQIAVTVLSGTVLTGLARPAALAASYVAVLVFVWRNASLPGMPVVGVGFALNAVVVVANGGMPVAAAALEAIGAPGADITPGKHLLLEETDVLPWLADIIALPVLRTVISVGDIVVAVGMAVVVVGLMQPRPRRPGREHPA